MQSLQLANDEHRNKFGFDDVTKSVIKEVDGKLCDTSIKINLIKDVVKPALLDYKSSNSKTSVLKDCFEVFRKFLSPRSTFKQPCFPNKQKEYKSVRLLDKIIAKFNFNMVVVSLNPPEQGFCVSICTAEGKTMNETHMKYHDSAFLDYIDNLELPPSMVDDWDELFSDVFCDGSVIVQLRDSRAGNPPFVHHILLQPHAETLANDAIGIILQDKFIWEPAERSGLESSVVNCAQLPIRLNPSPKKGLQKIRRQSRNTVFNTTTLRETVRLCSEEFSTMKINAKLSCPKSTSKLSNLVNRKIAKTIPCEMPSELLQNNNQESELTMNSSQLCEKIRKLAQPLKPFNSLETNDRHGDHLDDQSKEDQILEDQILEDRLVLVFKDQILEEQTIAEQLIEEHILETESIDLSSNISSLNHIKVSILQTVNEIASEYIGVLYVEKDYVEGENKGSMCRFTLGGKSNAKKYIKQFKEFVTEKGRKPVRITHLVPGQDPVITFTPKHEVRKSVSPFQIQHNTKIRINPPPCIRIPLQLSAAISNGTGSEVPEFSNCNNPILKQNSFVNAQSYHIKQLTPVRKIMNNTARRTVPICAYRIPLTPRGVQTIHSIATSSPSESSSISINITNDASATQTFNPIFQLASENNIKALKTANSSFTIVQPFTANFTPIISETFQNQIIINSKDVSTNSNNQGSLSNSLPSLSALLARKNVYDS